MVAIARVWRGVHGNRAHEQIKDVGICRDIVDNIGGYRNG